MNQSNYTPFLYVYEAFLSKITDDMYMELTPEDTYKILKELLISALPKFEFPRQDLSYEEKQIEETDEEGNTVLTKQWVFVKPLTIEEINIISTYMVVQWIGQQLASVENTRMKYSGSDFKFTSQANHIHKLLQLKKDYDREGFHLQRLYKRRIKDVNGIYRPTISNIMNTSSIYYVPQKDISNYTDLNSYVTLKQYKELQQYIKQINSNISKEDDEDSDNGD